MRAETVRDVQTITVRDGKLPTIYKGGAKIIRIISKIFCLLKFNLSRSQINRFRKRVSTGATAFSSISFNFRFTFYHAMTFSLLIDGVIRLARGIVLSSSPCLATRASQRTNVKSDRIVAPTEEHNVSLHGLEFEGETDRSIHDPHFGFNDDPGALECRNPSPKSGHGAPTIATRSQYFDQFIVKATKQMTHDGRSDIQMVLLKPGMNMRAYRLKSLSGVKGIYEVDGLEVIQKKHAIFGEMKTTLLSPRSSLSARVVKVPSIRGLSWKGIQADLVENNWPRELTDAGFDVDSRTIWVLEDLVCYLQYVHVLRLFKQIAQLSLPGSRVVFSAVTRRSCLDYCNTAPVIKSAMPNPERFLEQVGFRADRLDKIGEPNTPAFRNSVDPSNCNENELRDTSATIYVTAIKV